jgi:queuine tRNA-ribosyltransferase
VDVAFQLIAIDPSSQARHGRFRTTRGAIDTPLFMPVGTQATVKSLSPEELEELGADIILGNTYHLYLRPGGERVARLGGLHRFMHWQRSILTDSGGYQVFSLARIRKVAEEGVLFQSHVDGSRHLLTPETAIGVQMQLGSDIAMCLDECPPHTAARDYLVDSVERTLRWAKRCKEAHCHPHQALFGIVQGGTNLELRLACLERLEAIGFDGYAIGGLAVGESEADMLAVLAAVAPRLPAHQPRYLMGVGTPEDLVEAVSLGVDLFDCVLPTRNARNGMLFTTRGRLNIKNSSYAEDERPIEPGCGCYTCQRFSRAYLRHLFLARELLVYRLLTLHNLHYYLHLMAAMREAIDRGSFAAWRRGFDEHRGRTGGVPEP